MADFVIKKVKRARYVRITFEGNQPILKVPECLSDKQINDVIEENKEKIKIYIEKTQKNLEGVKPLTEEEVKRLTEEAVEYIPQKAKYYATKIGVSYNGITIKSQRSIWGSCSSKRNLNFNFIIMLLPEDIRDSIIVHELCHLKQMNHSRLFYEECKKVMPDYMKRDNWLTEHGNDYFKRLSLSDNISVYAKCKC